MGRLINLKRKRSNLLGALVVILLAPLLFASEVDAPMCTKPGVLPMTRVVSIPAVCNLPDDCVIGTYGRRLFAYRVTYKDGRPPLTVRLRPILTAERTAYGSCFFDTNMLGFDAAAVDEMNDLTMWVTDE